MLVFLFHFYAFFLFLIAFICIFGLKKKKQNKIKNKILRKHQQKSKIQKKKKKNIKERKKRKEASKVYLRVRDGSKNVCFLRNVTRNHAAIEETKTKPWTLKVALRPSGVLLMVSQF